MFPGCGAGEGCVWMRWIGILQALSLTDGVVGKHDESIAREQRSHGGVVRLAGGVMAGRHENCGVPSTRRWKIGYIEQRGDRKIRLAFEEHLSDAKTVALCLAQILRVERRAFREFAYEGQQLLSYRGLPCFSLGASANFGHVCRAFCCVLRCKSIENRVQRFAPRLRRAFCILRRGQGRLSRRNRSLRLRNGCARQRGD